MKDIEPILQILWRYQQRLVLSEDEVLVLREWLRESKSHEDLFDDLANEAKWISDAPPEYRNEPEGSLARIRMRLEGMELS